MRFEWDPNKATANEQKHGVNFDEAINVFQDDHSITVPDTRHSKQEKRFFTIGVGPNGQVLLVCHTDRAGQIRIISARPASRKERKQYAQSD